MAPEMTNLLGRIASRLPFVSDGYSGNPIERVVLDDGRELLLKRMSGDWDWMARASHDQGRIGELWNGGILERVPASIDHTIVGVEHDGEAWNVFMRDVGRALVPPDARVDRSTLRRILAAVAEFHHTFWDEPFPQLCGLVDRYSLFSPATGRRELEAGRPQGVVFTTGWEAFFENVPDDIGQAVTAILDDPALLAEQLDRFDKTLIHGDLRLGNLGLVDDRIALIDWGERAGAAPAAVDLGWFLGFDALRLDTRKEEVIADFRSLYPERWDEIALQLSLIGSLVQIGGLLGFWIAEASDDAERGARRDELGWWVGTARNALEVWSPV